MEGFLDRLFGFSFPFLFAGMWLAITHLLAQRSGWYELAQRFPDHPERPMVRLFGRSGSLDRVGYGGCLTLSAGPSGLRVSVWRIFGPFARPFLVPWSQLDVQRRNEWRAELRFGKPTLRTLVVSVDTANRLARDARGLWPAPELLEPKSFLAQVLWQWAWTTAAAAAFFIIAPRLFWPQSEQPPILVAIVLPAVTFGFGPLFQIASHLLRRWRGP